MPGRLRIVALGGEPALSSRIQRELPAPATLEAAGDATDPRFGDADLAVLAGPDWDERERALHAAHPELAIVLLCDAPEAAPVAAAIAGRRLSAAVQTDFRPGELAAACLAAHELSSLRRRVDEQALRYAERIDDLALLGEIGAHLMELPNQAAVLATIARELQRVLEVDLAAALVATGDSEAALHLHCHAPCDAYLARATRDRCIELFMTSSGRSIDEDTLRVEMTGESLAAKGAVRPPPASAHAVVHIGRRPVGVLFVSADRPGGFDAEDRRLLSFLAARTGDSLARLAARSYDETERLGLMVESMADGLLFADLGSDEVLINSAARRLLGIGPEELVTRHYLKHELGFYPFDLVASAASQEPLREELSIGGKDLSSVVSPVRDGGGNVVGVVVVLRDFTDTRALSRRQTEFVTMLSHELRTPLTSIAGALDIALSEQAGTLTDKQRRYLDMARTSSARLGETIDGLLDVARDGGGAVQMHFSEISLDELGREVTLRHRPAAEAKGIRLDVTAEEQNIRILGDPGRLTQVLNNLLTNAVKFTPPLGRIEVEVFGPSVAEGHVGVSVYNNGEAVPESERERIFERFDQGKDVGGSVRLVGGTGLGLASSRAIIEGHGGRIWVESGEAGEGTKFIFTLPSAPSDAAPAEAPVQAAPRPAKAAPAGSLILLVDADQYASYIVKGLLMAAGHEVLVATDTDEALSIARARHPALVVVHDDEGLDDPLALIEILEHDPDTKKAAVLVLSASRPREEALGAGADELLHLPFEPAELRDVCLRLIAEAGSARQSRILVVDDDTAIRTICREVLSHAGYQCREAHSGLAAIAEAKRFKPDLVLLDVMMPELDGFQTAEHFRGEPATSMVPIIFLSARAETADKVRAFRIGAEDYVVKPFVAAELVARVRKALERRDRELGASPTTQLPGAGAIEIEIERRLGTDAAFCYLDLDNLKAFNDYYGYAKADGVIRQTGDLVRDVIAREGNPGDFIGHIAGDDFVFITTCDKVDRVCATIASTFDHLVPLYYNKADRERGHIEACDRYGEMRKFPIMTVSLAAVTDRGITSYAELAAAAAAGKKLAKSIPGSSYVRDGDVLVGTSPAHRVA